MLISADLIVQAIFISAIFLAAISIPKQLYHMLYLRYRIAQIRNRGVNARRLHEEGKLTKEEYEEYLEYCKGQKGKEQGFKEEMKAWEQFVKSMHEPIIEAITSAVLIFAIILIPENFFSDQIGSILLVVFLVQAALVTTAVMSIGLRKMSASYDKHFREVADLLKEREVTTTQKERSKP